MANINEFSTVSWNPVGTAKYKVAITTIGYSPIHEIVNYASASIPAANLLLDAGAPRAGITQGGNYKILVYTEGVFGLSPFAELDVTVAGAPAPTGLAVS